MGYSIDIAAIGWWFLGCGSMLLFSLLALVSFGWRLIGHHVTNVIGEAGRRAVSERLGTPPPKTSGRRPPA